MRRSISIALGCLATILVSAASAQTAANGPYYATPSWDQTMPASTRFVVLANMNSETVLDRETGLVWWRAIDPNASVSVSAGQVACANSKVGGRHGWRVPTLPELTSLFDPAVTSAPFLPAGHPFQGFNGLPLVMTSTTSGLIDGYFYAVILSTPNAYFVTALNNAAIFCVRGPN